MTHWRTAKFISIARQLRTIDLWWLGQALLVLPICHSALIFFGLGQVQNFLWRLIPSTKKIGSEREVTPEHLATARRTAYMVDLAARHGFIHASCLRRSLVLWWFLHRQETAAEIKVGTQRIAGQFRAHAWVEWQGHVLNDRPGIGTQFASFVGPIGPSVVARK